MKIGFYGATGSYDFGDYAMMVHNIQTILNRRPDTEIYIYTPDKYITLQMLVDNMLDFQQLRQIKIVQEPTVLLGRYQRLVDKIEDKLVHKRHFFYSKYNNIKVGGEAFVNHDFMAAIKECDFLLFNGGGFLQHSWDYRNMNFAMAVMIAGSYGKSVYFLSNSVGPMQKWDFCVRDLLPFVQKMMIRDGYRYTQKYLESLRFDRFMHGPDDLFFVNDEYPTEQKYENYVVIEVMTWLGRASKGETYVLNQLVHLVDEVINEDRKNVVLVSFDRGDSDADRYMEYIQVHAMHPERISIESTAKCNMYEIFSLYRYCDFSVSLKYHPLILALGSNKPCIGIICDDDGYYEGKLRGACDNLGIDSHDVVMHIDEINSTSLLERYNSLKDGHIIINPNRREQLKAIRQKFLQELLE